MFGKSLDLSAYVFFRSAISCAKGRSYRRRRLVGSVGMANVLTEEKKQQVVALGDLGWSLRSIQQTTKIRRSPSFHTQFRGCYLEGPVP